ncbi:uncharacterized protein LOC123708284 [Pieris brassicae]|uniref:Uncharacterized protein n=1 Tax=Pieris brassicae TaxID=7116 RepID=A0A9P0WUQ8_PIEBR|nr:uncharacterized protein LOC123708284 [Pieris brassicae]CAH3858390.1 unnamed protein product [Pieris brassicae]
MAAQASRKTLAQLIRQGYDEIPEIYASSVLALVGIGLGTVGCYNYYKRDGDNKRYKKMYVVMRPDDPRVAKIRKE